MEDKHLRGAKMKKIKLSSKHKGSLLAFALVVIIVLIGFNLGRYISYEYNRRQVYGFFNVILHQTTEIPINYILNDGPKPINELCERETGLCEKELGIISLNRIDINLSVNINLDNPADGNTFIRMNDQQINILGTLNLLMIMDNRFLVITELGENNHYTIRIFNHRGQELIYYPAINLDNDFSLEGNNLLFSYCDRNDISINEANEEEELIESEEMFRYHRFLVSSDDIMQRISISSEYKKCAN